MISNLKKKGNFRGEMGWVESVKPAMPVLKATEAKCRLTTSSTFPTYGLDRNRIHGAVFSTIYLGREIHHHQSSELLHQVPLGSDC